MSIKLDHFFISQEIKTKKKQETSATMDVCFKVGKSKTMIDLTMFTFEEYWDDPGKGLFQTRDGGIPIKFVGPGIFCPRFGTAQQNYIII